MPNEVEALSRDLAEELEDHRDLDIMAACKRLLAAGGNWGDISYLHKIIKDQKSALQAVQWPRYTPDRTLRTTERSWELIIKNLEKGYPELAWGLLKSAITHVAEHPKWEPGSDRYDLTGWFREEAILCLQVLQHWYTDRKRFAQSRSPSYT